MSSATSALQILEKLRAQAKAGNVGLLYAFMNKGAGSVRPRRRSDANDHLSGWALTSTDTPWSTFNDDQLIEAVRICEAACPGVLFLRHRSKPTTIDKLRAWFMSEDRSLEERITGERRIDDLVVECSDRLPNLFYVTYGAFRQIRAEQRAVLIERHQGGNISIVTHLSLEQGDTALFDTLIGPLCESTPPGPLIAAYSDLYQELRKHDTPAAEHMRIVLRDAFEQRGLKIGTIKSGWNRRQGVRQYVVEDGMTRYVQTFRSHSRAIRNDQVQQGDIVVFNPNGIILVDRTDEVDLIDGAFRKVIGVAFQVVFAAT